MSPQAPRIGLATVTKVSFSLGGMGGTHCVLSLTQPSGKSDSSGLLRHGRGRGITSGVCAGSSEVQAVPCGLQNSVWDIPWLGLASSWNCLLARDQLQLWHHRGTASRSAPRQGSCLCAAVATVLLSKISALCWSKVASLAIATTVTRGRSLGSPIRSELPVSRQAVAPTFAAFKLARTRLCGLTARVSPRL